MRKRRIIAVIGSIALLASGAAHARAARDYIYIVGSSTVYPFSTVVAERFGRATRFKTPKVESTGTGGGFKLFCAGVGVQYPDINDASRAIEPSEVERCKRHGVEHIVEVKIGYDGIVVASAIAGPRVALTRKQLFMALAKNVPDPRGAERLVPNPYRRWRDIDAALPDEAIEVYGPPPTSGTRDAFAELVMQGGCQAFGWLRALERTDKRAFKAACHAVREDGAYIEAGENDNLIVQKLGADPHAFGIFGFSYLDQNADRIRGAAIDGVAATFENIASGAYPVSRPLFIYVKAAHVGHVPGMRAYLDEFSSDRATGDDGYLVDKGLIPMPAAERARVHAAVLRALGR